MNIKKTMSNQSKIFNILRIGRSYSFQPFFILFHITQNCNCNCDECYQARDKFYDKTKEINLNEFERILKEVKELFFIKPRIHLFGGEPLVHSNFQEVLNIVKKYKFLCSLTTNGILLDKYDLSNVKEINVSIDGIGDDHDKQRNYSGAFDSIIKNINFISKNKDNKTQKMQINVNCLITKKNYKKLVDLTKYFRDNKIVINSLSFQHKYYKRGNNEANLFDLNILGEEIEEIFSVKTDFTKLIIPNINKSDLYDFYNEKNVFKKKCFVPWAGLNIFPNLDSTPGGAVLGCNSVVGNLREDTIKKVWNNSKMRLFRKNLLKHGLPEICNRCCHRQYY